MNLLQMPLRVAPKIGPTMSWTLRYPILLSFGIKDDTDLYYHLHL